MEKKFAKVIVDLSHKDVDRPFHYKVPEGCNPDIGSRVIIPFGKGNKLYDGFIVGFDETIDFPESKVKSIVEIPDSYPMLSETMLELAFWMQKKYYTTLTNCIHCLIPAGMKMKSDFVYSLIDPNILPELKGKSSAIATYIAENGNLVAERELSEAFGSTLSSLRSMESKGILEKQQISHVKNLTMRINYAFLNREMEGFEEAFAAILTENSLQSKVLRLLQDKDMLPVADIKIFLHSSDSPIKTLNKKGLLTIEPVVVRRNPYSTENFTQTTAFKPTEEQKQAISFLTHKWKVEDRKPVLIHGVTGSGKTEIYLQMIDEALQSGKQAIVLVPEISLTPQAVQIFVGRFGNKVAVTHSRLSMGERFDQWERARLGEISIMLGPRSAIFTPFNQLGLIILDEEHEHTYKSEISPKYDAKEIALKLSELTGALVLLGSATPRVESFYEAEQGLLDLICLEERVNKQPPQVDIIDMRIELANGNRSIFGAALATAIEENLLNKQQTILFLNRRGHSSFVSCRSCGYVLSCDDCNVNYTYHIHDNSLVCHYCGKTQENPSQCPICGSAFIKYFGVGTQKVENAVKKQFPQARVLRMDMDTTSGKFSHKKILDQFKSQEADILIGTQMIAKGLDFPNVTLVGIIAADISLNAGDFRSGETTFQLLTQVSGRAGRAQIKGQVYIQTYNPDHYSIQLAQTADYLKFYQQEIALRRQMQYPPFTKLFHILFTGESEKNIIILIFKLVDIIQLADPNHEFETIGPAPSIISKIKNKYRWRLMVKAVDEEKLKHFVIHAIDTLKKQEAIGAISIQLTLNPVSLS